MFNAYSFEDSYWQNLISEKVAERMVINLNISWRWRCDDLPRCDAALGPGDLFIFVSNSSGPDHWDGPSLSPVLWHLMMVTWLPASLSNTEISNPLNIFCHLKIQCFVTDVSSTSGGFGFQDLNFFDFLQSDKELDLSEDVATTVRCLKVQVDRGKSFMGDNSRVFNVINVSWWQCHRINSSGAGALAT